MKAISEQTIYTTAEQWSTIKSNETQDGLMVLVGEAGSSKSDSRLYLTTEEAIELSNMLKAMVDKIKTNSL